MKLNMGCGKDVLTGWVNADRVALPGVNILCDFSSTPFPFKNDRFSEIRAVNLLEHLPDTVKTMEEIWRVCKTGARIHIRVPHYKSSNAYKDPTHRSFFTEDSFEYFDKGSISWYSSARFKVKSVRKVYQYHVDRYIKRPFPRLLPFVERHFDNTVESIEFELEAIK